MCLAALLLGKPLGICCFCGRPAVRRALPPGLQGPRSTLVGIGGSIGFTVSLFFATAAFTSGTALAETKMGALFQLRRGADRVPGVATAPGCGAPNPTTTEKRACPAMMVPAGSDHPACLSHRPVRPASTDGGGACRRDARRSGASPLPVLIDDSGKG